MHTNGTIGALVNATFGNAPELLISIAALRSGFYRLTQLTMLGSMITNMIFVFGVACLIGGLRWHVQDIRLTSGNVSVVMLLVSTAGSLLPATLILSGHFDRRPASTTGAAPASDHARQRSGLLAVDSTPTQEEITLSRVNAAVLLFLYVCFLIFQLHTHKEEFDDETAQVPARPNLCCQRLCQAAKTSSNNAQLWFPSARLGIKQRLSNENNNTSSPLHLEMATPPSKHKMVRKRIPGGDGESGDWGDGDFPTSNFRIQEHDEETASLLLHLGDESESSNRSSSADQRLGLRMKKHRRKQLSPMMRKQISSSRGLSSSASSGVVLMDAQQPTPSSSSKPSIDISSSNNNEPLLSMRTGIFWLFVVTMCISAISDVLVDTIDGFAQRMQLSQVFTSMVIIPFFSNVAEQVSAVIFAYRNKMDLCVGVTVGSAIQIATFVLPGAVLMAAFMDRSMTLYFHSYETVCWFFCTVVVGAVLQNGSTNWLVGACLVGIYIMFAAGIWYHEIENLSIDAESTTIGQG